MPNSRIGLPGTYLESNILQVLLFEDVFQSGAIEGVPVAVARSANSADLQLVLLDHAIRCGWRPPPQVGAAGGVLGKQD